MPIHNVIYVAIGKHGAPTKVLKIGQGVGG